MSSYLDAIGMAASSEPHRLLGSRVRPPAISARRGRDGRRSQPVESVALGAEGVREDITAAPVAATRLGPGQFLLAVDDLRPGTAFSIEDRTSTVVSEPAELTKLNYLVTVHETAGPDRGRQLRVQVRLGRPRPGPARAWPGPTAATTRARTTAEKSASARRIPTWP